MRVKDCMTAGIIGLPVSATIWEALTLLIERGVSALVIFDDAGAPAGVLSEGDLMRRTELDADRHWPAWLGCLLDGDQAERGYAEARGRKVSEIMTPTVYAIDAEAELPQAIDLMLARRVRRLVVMEHGFPVGVISRSEILLPLLGAASAPAVPCADDQLRARVEKAIELEPWSPSRAVRVEVADGVVTLQGALTDNSLRTILKLLCENVPGVREVRDHLAWVEPYSGYVAHVAAAIER